MRLLGLTTTLAAAAALTLGAVALGHAAPVPPLPQEGTSHIKDLRLGEYWFGPDIEPEDLVGKVVLVEIWGK